MRQRQRFRTTIAALAITSFLPFTESAAQPAPLQGLDQYVQRAVRDWEATGLAIAVVQDGELLFAKGYGTQRLGADGAVDAHTRFSIGSTTKAMTAAALGMLVDAGKLGWDDKVTRHLPWFTLSDPWVTREITVRDLLTHRAGLGNADFLWYERPVTTRSVLDKLALVPPAYSMRSSFVYQNLMYAAAGEVVAAVSGMPWTEFVRTRIFVPLGMQETVPLLAEITGQTNVAQPHDRVDGTIVPIENASVDPVAGAGSVWSSVSDMSRWLRFLLAGGVTEHGTRLLAEATVDELFKPQSFVTPAAFYPTQQLTKPHWMTYGLAWFQQDYRGEKLDFHTGSIDGMVAIAGLVRDRNIGVYVLANRDHVEVRHALMLHVLDLFLDDASSGVAPSGATRSRDWSRDLKVMYDSLTTAAEQAAATSRAARVTGTSPSLALAAYAGRYADPLFGELVIIASPDGLRANVGPGQPAAVEHWQYDTFRIAFDARWRGEMMATFVLGADGTPAVVRVDGVELRRVR